MIEEFLRRHDVDVGRFLAAISFSSALTRLFGMVGALLAGRIFLDLGLIIALIVGAGLWQHKAWARGLVIIMTWLALVFFAALVVAVLIGTRLNVTLTFGSTTFAHPTPLQAIVFGCITLPLAALLLTTLYTDKVKREFGPA